MSSDITWNMEKRKRWQLSVTFKTVTSLHIGCGAYVHHDDIKNKNGKHVDINAFVKGKGNLPIIPGSSIKGKFLQWLGAKTDDVKLLELVFGKGHDPKTAEQGSGGRAEFHDAQISKKLREKQPWPYWMEKRQTCINASTAIDRHTGTALRQSLHYTEVVPPGVCFVLNISGVMSKDEVNILLAALNACNDPDTGICFGAGDAAGMGKIILCDAIQAGYMDNASISTWLNSVEDASAAMPMDAPDCVLELDNPAIRERIQPVVEKFSVSDAHNLKLDLTLQFDGPFIVNDPGKENADDREQSDKSPLADDNGNPILPATSFRGALRSQAERIVRTLGGRCCDTEHPCKALYKLSDVDNLCPVCQIFGATGWKSTLRIHDFKCIKVDRKDKRQDFVAIDRFHGGGKDGAKFDTVHSERPCFTGAIEISSRMSGAMEWGKGLLALTLRDLLEGDITFGFGANKGYGHLETKAVTISNLNQLAPHIEQFRKILVDQPGHHTCADASMPEKQEEITRHKIKTGQQDNQAAFS